MRTNQNATLYWRVDKLISLSKSPPYYFNKIVREAQAVMNEHLQALRQTLAQDIPITHHMSITVENYNDKGLILKAPLTGNTNPKGTAFAGSINALLTLAGWGQIWLILRELEIVGDVVIQDSRISYLHPVTGDFAALCHRPDQDDIVRLNESLQKKKRARIELSAKIYQKSVIAVEFKGRYVIHMSQNDITSLSARSSIARVSSRT